MLEPNQGQQPSKRHSLLQSQAACRPQDDLTAAFLCVCNVRGGGAWGDLIFHFLMAQLLPFPGFSKGKYLYATFPMLAILGVKEIVYRYLAQKAWRVRKS